MFWIGSVSMVYHLNIATWLLLGHPKKDMTSVLEWFWARKSSLRFKYTHDAIWFAASNGHVHVLDWFNSHGFNIGYGTDIMDTAAANGHIKYFGLDC